jgi:hypothetical protein
VSETQDATPPEGEWSEFFLGQIRRRDDEIAVLRNEISRREAVLLWLAENTPRSLELCPIKIKPSRAANSHSHSEAGG